MLASLVTPAARTCRRAAPAMAQPPLQTRPRPALFTAARVCALCAGCAVLLLLTARPATAAAPPPDFDAPAIQQQAQDYMLARLCQLRAGAGLAPVLADPQAGEAARLHAQDMLTRSYFSHWNPEGLKPTRRFNLLGGYHALGENILYFHGPFTTVPQMVDVMLDQLMASPGHRKTILDPAYTHVGLYLAASPARGDVYLAQEFIARLGGEYRCPLAAAVGQQIEFAGRFDPAHYSFDTIFIGYEPRPVPRDFLWLSRTGSYHDGDKIVAAYTADPHLEFKAVPTFHEVELNTAQGWFKSGVRLNYKGGAGLYYIFLWLRNTRSGQPVLAATVSVDVTVP